MSELLEMYKHIVGSAVIDQLQQFATMLKGIKVLHINSTKEGGGVAEILHKMVPLSNELGVESHWEVVEGNPLFFQCTKMFHNLLQGYGGFAPNSHELLHAFEETNAKNAERLAPFIREADIVLIHDPQPLPLITHFPDVKAKWVWRCHIDVATPSRVAWKYLRRFIEEYDASIFSLEDFTQPLSLPMFIIAPSIDPCSEKNRELSAEEVRAVYEGFHIDYERPIALQVSRFDRFKDPLGVIEAYKLAKKFYPTLQLVLAGGGATDDPEGEMILQEVRKNAEGDPNIHILFLPSDAHHTINALQRGASIVLQKSLKEGFGLTVTEALWKMKPVIGGNAGGIRLQVINHNTGFLVDTPEGAAHRIRYLLQNPQKAKELGAAGKKLVRENFLLTRQLREYLTVFSTLLMPNGDRMELGGKREGK